MIYLVKNSTNDIYLTLTEKQRLATPNYLFRFVHRSLNSEVKFVLLYASDMSYVKNRYNLFSIVTNSYFTNQKSGEWEYYIYEQISASNTNPNYAHTLLETGIMKLSEASAFTYSKYSTNNTFITR